MVTLKMRPAIVVPVLVALRGAEPWFRAQRSKEKPIGVVGVGEWVGGIVLG